MDIHKQLIKAIQKGINLAVDDFDDLDTTLEVQKKARIKDDVHISKILWIQNNCIDLELPSGTLWAKEPLPEYYAWGEVKEKDHYDWNNYKFVLNDNLGNIKLTKYCSKPSSWYSSPSSKPDKKVSLESRDDTATVLLGEPWHIPSKQQMEELLSNTTIDFIFNDWKKYVVFTSKINGNQLSLEICGKRGIFGEIADPGYGFYWTSDSCIESSNFSSFILYIGDNSARVSADVKRSGLKIIPVCNI